MWKMQCLCDFLRLCRKDRKKKVKEISRNILLMTHYILVKKLEDPSPPTSICPVSDFSLGFCPICILRKPLFLSFVSALSKITRIIIVFSTFFPTPSPTSNPSLFENRFNMAFDPAFFKRIASILRLFSASAVCDFVFWDVFGVSTIFAEHCEDNYNN